MALSDVTPQGVERAIAEFERLGREAFLAEHGYGKALGYFLVRDERRYDSKAIAGVAHGHDRPDLGPLTSEDFSGGDATVARHLESLGFDVERPPRNPPWAEEELILALHLYLREGLLDDKDQAVIELSRDLNALTLHPERPDADRFRNPNGVALKLANFAALDPNYAGVGMKRLGKRDREAWVRYASEEDALAEAAAAIRQGLEPRTLETADTTEDRVIETEVEAQHVERFQVSATRQDIEAERREQSVVHAYREHLESQGHNVKRHLYPLPGTGSQLACDLVDKTAQVLYEAKGNVRRSSVRMAIGQLLDYRRFEPKTMTLAVLLPRKPPQDLIELIRSVPALTVWRTEHGFDRDEP
ncbi:MAG: hypothetical protein F4089_06350 [Gammaproteobacteria bacterium]|nr:hypothetical protein [Rhodospirillaceae bacterium]MYJ74733.1 hypothetical protein [Gammaproteobacteria bacterium]